MILLAADDLRAPAAQPPQGLQLFPGSAHRRLRDHGIPALDPFDGDLRHVIPADRDDHKVGPERQRLLRRRGGPHARAGRHRPGLFG